MGYVIIKYMDVSEGDYRVIQSERMSVEEGEHIYHPKEFEGYTNIPYPEPPIEIPDICDEDWILPERELIPWGSQRVILNSIKRLVYVEFYYKKVVE